MESTRITWFAKENLKIQKEIVILSHLLPNEFEPSASLSFIFVASESKSRFNVV